MLGPFAVALLALCVGHARAQVSDSCINTLNALQSCAAGGLTGSALGAACCTELQTMYNQCEGVYGIRMLLLGNFQYLQYWDILLASLNAQDCPCKPRKSLG